MVVVVVGVVLDSCVASEDLRFFCPFEEVEGWRRNDELIVVIT